MSEIDPDLQKLIDAAADGDNPTPADRARIRLALMATVATGAATAAAGTSDLASAGATKAGTTAVATAKGTAVAKTTSTVVLGNVVAKGIVVAVVISGATAGIVRVWPENQSSRPPEQTALPMTIPSGGARTSEPMVMPPANSAAVETDIPLPELSAKTTPSVAPVHSWPRRTSTSAPSASAKRESADGLLLETQRLRNAHQALQGGDPKRALELLSDRRAENEGQELREERTAARVLALCKLGRIDEANGEVARYLAENPQSPLASRVRKACAPAK